MWRIIDISGNGYTLAVENKNIVITNQEGESSHIPFSDIHSILFHGYGTLLSESFIENCIKLHIPLVFCDEKHLPLGITVPYCQHTDSLQRLKAQIDITLPMKKQIWKQIIKAKIQSSELLLRELNLNEYKDLHQLEQKVLSGDTSNTEAQAARIYFTALFGPDFSRRDESFIENALLNYGYTIIRSSVARALASAGLDSKIGIFHSGRINPFCLVDDLMEPLRVFVDSTVISILKEIPGKVTELTPTIKKVLINTINLQCKIGDITTDLNNGIYNYVMSFLDCIEKRKESLLFPKRII